MADKLQEPALATPSGVISQFPTTHSDEQAWYYVCATLCALVPGILLLLRLYTRLRIIHKTDITDYITMSSFLFFIALLICGRMCLGEGAGVHQWNLPMHNLIGVLYWFYIGQIVYAPTMFLVKLAILLQYLCTFAPQRILNPFMWYSARIVIVVMGIYYIISTCMAIFACSPREAIWNPLITNAKCLNRTTDVIFSRFFNIVSDIIILLLPARTVWKLRIPTRKKVGIVLLFAIGLLACIASVMMIIYVTRLEGENADVSYNTAWQSLWSYAEISLGMIVTCLLSLPKFIEVKGTKLRGFLSSLTRSFPSLTSGWSFGSLVQSKKITNASQDTIIGGSTMAGHSESDLPFSYQDCPIESYPFYEGVHNPAKTQRVNAIDIPQV